MKKTYYEPEVILLTSIYGDLMTTVSGYDNVNLTQDDFEEIWKK